MNNSRPLWVYSRNAVTPKSEKAPSPASALRIGARSAQKRRQAIIAHTTSVSVEGAEAVLESLKSFDETKLNDGLSAKNPDDVVFAVLKLIQDTDNGMNMTDRDRKIVDYLIEALQVFGRNNPPLDDPRLFGDYDVAYVSSGPSQEGNPAGGRFRGALGRLLFHTTALEQNLIAPDGIVNKLVFRVFGLIPGMVTLTGTIAPEPADQKRWVRARFGSPMLSLFGLPAFKMGPHSSVVLSTTYLDDKVRIGKGSRGSLFVFTRTEKGKQTLKTRGKKVIKNPVPLLIAAAYAVAYAMYNSKSWLKPASLVMLTPVIWAGLAAVAIAIALVLRNGGIQSDNHSPAYRFDNDTRAPTQKIADVEKSMAIISSLA